MTPTSIPHEKAMQFILGGKATVIFHNTQTGGTHKYRINKHEHHDIWYVNTADHQINKLVGRIFAPNPNHDTHWFKPDDLGTHTYPKDTEVFGWMWKRIVLDRVPAFIDIMHTGSCAACGRPLTDPISITAGFGPECRKNLGITI